MSHPEPESTQASLLRESFDVPLFALIRSFSHTWILLIDSIHLQATALYRRFIWIFRGFMTFGCSFFFGVTAPSSSFPSSISPAPAPPPSMFPSIPRGPPPLSAWSSVPSETAGEFGGSRCSIGGREEGGIALGWIDRRLSQTRFNRARSGVIEISEKSESRHKPNQELTVRNWGYLQSPIFSLELYSYPTRIRPIFRMSFRRLFHSPRNESSESCPFRLRVRGRVWRAYLVNGF